MSDLGPSLTNFNRISRYLKLFTNSLNIRILNQLQYGEKCVSELVKETGEQQAYVSKQLKILYENKLLNRRREKVSIYYTIRNTHIFELFRFIKDLKGVRSMENRNLKYKKIS